MEFTRRSGLFSKDYSLAVTIAVHGEDAIEPQLRDAAAALIEWCKRRGRAAKQVVFTVHANPEQLEHLERQVERCTCEGAVKAVLRSLEMHLSLLDLAGNPLKDRPLAVA
ncbi:MAG: hypothetical protein QM767_03485 [Anaeromyxobacter sp.]